MARKKSPTAPKCMSVEVRVLGRRLPVCRSRFSIFAIYQVAVLDERTHVNRYRNLREWVSLHFVNHGNGKPNGSADRGFHELHTFLD